MHVMVIPASPRYSTFSRFFFLILYVLGKDAMIAFNYCGDLWSGVHLSVGSKMHFMTFNINLDKCFALAKL